MGLTFTGVCVYIYIYIYIYIYMRLYSAVYVYKRPVSYKLETVESPSLHIETVEYV
jgi:hypothetical protein